MSTQNERAVIDLVINGQQAEATGKQLTKTYIDARKALAQMAETDPGYAKQKREVEALMKAQQARIVKINEEKTAWEKFKANSGSMIAGVAGGNLVSAGISKLLELGPAVVDRQMKIRDQFADIAKAADLSDSEVKDLNESLKKIDTRTATEDLRNMAVVGGQFGIAKKDMEGFVESADKLNVALGDQFDSVEKVAETSLTLRNTFQDMKTDNIADDMLKIGNGLNYLEAQGAATAPVMADFSSRIGGIAIPLGLSSGQVLGLSATLQELNVTAERGSSAVTDILAGITKAPDTFAKYAKGVDGANLSTKQFKELVNSDLNAALMAVIRGFKEGDTSATGMAAKLADMDIKGNGVMEIFMKLASNTDLLTQRQTQSAEALSNTSSITAEFSKKNHELSVNLKKLGEWFDSFLENETLGRFAGGIVSITVKLLGLNTEVNKASKSYAEQRTRIADLEKQMSPLLERYDQLTKKSKLNRTEQDELKKITAQVTGVMPAAATEFDNYGVAVGLSTTRVREMIAAQREMQKEMQAGALEEQRTQLRSIEWQRQQILKQIKSRETVTVSASGNATATPLSGEDIKRLQGDLVKLQTQTAGTLDTMRQLEGMETTTDRRKARRAAEGADKPKPKNDQFGKAATEAEEKARLKKEKDDERAGKKALKTAEKHEDDYARLIEQARERTAQFEKNEFEKEQLQFGEHYSKLYELAGENKEKQADVTQLMYSELSAMQTRENERQYKKAKKQSDDLLKLAIKELEHKRTIELAAVQSRVAAGGISPEAGRLAELQIEQTFLSAKELLYSTHYESLKTIAGENETALTEIKQGAADAQEGIDASKTNNEAEQASARGAIKDAELEHDVQIHRQKKQMAREEIEFRRQILGELTTMLSNDWTSSIQGYKDYWKQASIVQKVALVASKAWALAEIGINLSRQITLINTAAALADAVFPGSGIAIRIKGLTMAIGTAALQTGRVLATNVPTPAFEKGGFSDEKPGGYVSQATNFGGRFIAGEKGREWIMSAPMLRNPVMANLAGALQALQVSGGYRNITASNTNGGSSGAGTAGGMSDQLLMQLIQETQAQRSALDSYAGRPIQFDYLAHERKKQEVDTIRQVTGL